MIHRFLLKTMLRAVLMTMLMKMLMIIVIKLLSTTLRISPYEENDKALQNRQRAQELPWNHSHSLSSSQPYPGSEFGIDYKLQIIHYFTEDDFKTQKSI